MAETESPDNNERIPHTAASLLQHCQTLLSELETFKEYLKSRKQDHQVEIAHFRNTVKSEHRTLLRLVETSESQQSQHTVNSSNLPFLETLWSVVKSNTGLVGMQKRFYWNEAGQKRGQKKQNSALVDVVAKDGLEWFKISLLTNNRLLFDKAKQGWEDASSSEEEEEDEDSDEGKEQEMKKQEENDTSNDVPLVKMTKDLIRASSDVKIRTLRPSITLILPKIIEHQIPAIDSTLLQLRNLGVSVLTSTSVTSPPPFHLAMPNLLTNPFSSFTPTLNIDCTILLALVSDFSHQKVSTESWFHHALKRQVQIEDEENLLPELLYPALCNRNLICTDEAAKRMREIVNTIGTPTEKQRTALFMNDDDIPSSQLSSHLSKLSRFDIPETLRLPILIQVPDFSKNDEQLPPSAEKVKEQLTLINQSVFLWGWKMGYTTITSNRTVVKQIENVLGREAKEESEWPGIWLCPTARSLVGKEKGRRD